MTRWIGSLLIAAVSSVVTLLLAWSSLGPPAAKNDGVDQDAAKMRDSAAQAVDAYKTVSAAGDATAEMLQQLAMIEVPDQGDQPNRGLMKPGDWTRHRSGTALPMTADSPSPRMRIEFCERCNEVANDIDPSLARRLDAMRQQDPAEFERNMKIFGRKLFALGELKKHDPDLYAAKLNELRMELTVRQRANDLREARAAGHTVQAEQYEAALRMALQMQLAWSLKARGDLLCRLEEQVRQIRSEMSDQAARMNELVEERFQALLQNPQPVLGSAGTVECQPQAMAAMGKD